MIVWNTIELHRHSTERVMPQTDSGHQNHENESGAGYGCI